MKQSIATLVLMLCIPIGGLAQAPKLPALKKETLVDRHGDPLPDGAISRLGTMRFRHGFGGNWIAFSPNGKVLASVGRFPTLCLWDADSGRLLRRVSTGYGANAVGFSPDGSKVFTGFHLIEVATGKVLREFKSRGPGDSAAFSPDGVTLASSDREGDTANIILWDANTGKDLRVLTGHRRGYVTSLAFSPKDGKILASASEDKTVRIWDTVAGKELHCFDAHKEPVNRVAFAPDGKTLASAGEDGFVRLWDVAAGKPLRQIKPENVEIYSIAFSKDGKLLACCGHGGIISLWNPDTGKLVRKWDTFARVVGSLAFAPDGKRLASSGFGAIVMWDFETGKEIKTEPSHQANITLLRFAPDGKSAFSTGRDLRFYTWDVNSGQANGGLFSDTAEPKQQIWTALDISRDGKRMAHASLEYLPEKKEFQPVPAIRIWDTSTRKLIHTLNGHKGRVFALHFAPDGKRLASGGNDGMRLWDAVAGVPLHHILPKVLVTAIVYSPDGKLLAASDRDVQIHLCDAATGKVIRSWQSGSLGGTQLCFSPDGKLLATSDGDVIGVWATDTGKEIMRIGIESSFTLLFSPDGRILANAGLLERMGADGYREQKGAIQLWELRTGQPIRQFDTPQGLVFSLAFAPDRRTLASGGGDSTILLWDLTGHGKSKPPAPNAVELDKLWSDLAGDASKADRAHWTLALSPKQSVPFLAKRLRPAAAADEKQVARLLGDLENKTLDVRQKAVRALIELGESAEAGLRKSLDGKLPVETCRRVEQILAKREPDALRHLRAIDSLAEIGSAEARLVLDMLAKGTPNPRVATAAEAAWKRLGK